MTDFEADTCWCELGASFSLTDAFLSPAWSDASFSFHAHLAPPLTSLEFAGEPEKCQLLVVRLLAQPSRQHVCVMCELPTWLVVSPLMKKFLIMRLRRSNNTTPRLSSALILTGGAGRGEASAEVMRLPHHQ